MKTVNLKGKDIISIPEITKEEIMHILKVAEELKKKPQPKLLDGLVMGSCFFEPSTRTRLSFETAMQRLGGRVIGFADPGVTSAKKVESLYDAMKIIGQYFDVIAMRHPVEGAARRAAEVTDKPIKKDLSSPLAPQDCESSVIVVTCGPELMQKKVLDICNQYNVDCEVSIERYMKCGVRVCGQCAVDDLGICMCKEGPVVKKELANKIKEFGFYHRDKSGAIINL